MRLTSTMGICVLLLLGCGENKPPEKTVFDAQLQALKKARAVEQKLKEGAHQRYESVEREGESENRGDADPARR